MTKSVKTTREQNSNMDDTHAELKMLIYIKK